MGYQLFKEATGNSRRTWVLAVPILVFVLFIVGQLLVLFPAARLGLVTRETVETWPTVLYLVAGSFAMAALLFVAWIRWFERRSLASAGLVFGAGTGRVYIRDYLLGLLMGAGVVCRGWLMGADGLESQSALTTRDLVPIVVMMAAFMLQSATEEMVFRGWMMGRIAERFGLTAGIVANSLLFTLMHVEFGTLAQTSAGSVVIFTLATLLFSIFLSLLVVRERSIWGAAAWHAAWNWIFITWFGLPTTGIELNMSPLVVDLMPVDGSATWLTGGVEGPEGSLMTPVVLVIGCLTLLILRKKRAPAVDQTNP